MNRLFVRQSMIDMQNLQNSKPGQLIEDTGDTPVTSDPKPRVYIGIDWAVKGGDYMAVWPAA